MKQIQTLKNELTLTHELSMKLMWSGQIIFEIEELYTDNLSRQLKEKVHQASQLIKELADEVMTPMTKARMLDWQGDKIERTYYEYDSLWKSKTEEEMKNWRNEVNLRCKQGFLKKF